jgi:hypothetical protein
MGYTDIDSLDHDPKLAQALGNMVVAWARAETVLVKLYAEVTGLHYNTAAVIYYKIPTFESRIRVLTGLIEEKQEPFPKRADMKKAVHKLAKLSSTRNHWVHGTWCCPTGTNDTVYFSMRLPASARSATPIKTSDVENHVAAVRKRTRNIKKFSNLKIALRSSK